VNPAYVRAISGMPSEQASEILKELFDELTRPQYVYRHSWEEDDLLIWDNNRLVHKATTLDLPKGAERIMWRMQTRDAGNPPGDPSFLLQNER